MHYVGNIATVLRDHIENSLLGSEGDDSPRVLYTHYMAIIQSSGMGKSRAVDEVGKRELVIPMVLRPDGLTGMILYYPDLQPFPQDIPLPIQALDVISQTLVLGCSNACLHCLS